MAACWFYSYYFRSIKSSTLILNKIFCLGWFLFQHCQSLSVSATKMQDFKQLAHNFRQSSYLPFEDSVITSHFITQDKVGARNLLIIMEVAMQHSALCIITVKTGDNVGLPPITNDQDRASSFWWHGEWENSQARCGDADSLKEWEEGDKCRRRRSRSRKCWQRVKVKER